MKKLFCIVCLLMQICVQAQNIGLQNVFPDKNSKNEPKPVYTYLVIYREWNQYMHYMGDIAKKSKPKRVEIQEEKWTEEHYEIIK